MKFLCVIILPIFFVTGCASTPDNQTVKRNSINIKEPIKAVEKDAEFVHTELKTISENSKKIDVKTKHNPEITKHTSQINFSVERIGMKVKNIQTNIDKIEKQISFIEKKLDQLKKLQEEVENNFLKIWWYVEAFAGMLLVAGVLLGIFMDRKLGIGLAVSSIILAVTAYTFVQYILIISLAGIVILFIGLGYGGYVAYANRKALVKNIFGLEPSKKEKKIIEEVERKGK